MSDERLKVELARQVLGWKSVPGRFIKHDRSWTPSWRFDPLMNLEDAFHLLDHAATAYTLCANTGEDFRAEVIVGKRAGQAAGEPKARMITMALAQALGLDLRDEVGPCTSPQERRRDSRSRSIPDGV